jgi:hypothetical protein
LDHCIWDLDEVVSIPEEARSVERGELKVGQYVIFVNTTLVVD